jgi:hypothetical protein
MRLEDVSRETRRISELSVRSTRKGQKGEERRVHCRILARVDTLSQSRVGRVD